jgi:hypothetical protein
VTQVLLTPEEVEATPRGLRRITPRAAAMVFAAAIVLIGIVLVLTLPHSRHLAAAPVPANPQIEAKYGVRVTQVASTADGGMVDFRFIVLDPDKALAWMNDVTQYPIMRAEDTGAMIVSTADMSMVGHSLNSGQTYFLLYRNTGGSVTPGTPVTVMFGDLQINHIVAR